MEQESKNGESNFPILCANNCGFFGSSATKNLCSKCYKDSFLAKSKATIDQVPVLETPRVEEKPKGGAFLEEGNTSSEGNQGMKKASASRCKFCSKRVGLMGFKCRCGEVFCSLHRYSDKHNCVFDYRGEGQDAIAKANPVVKADKVDKI